MRPSLPAIIVEYEFLGDNGYSHDVAYIQVCMYMGHEQLRYNVCYNVHKCNLGNERNISTDSMKNLDIVYPSFCHNILGRAKFYDYPIVYCLFYNFSYRNAAHNEVYRHGHLRMQVSLLHMMLIVQHLLMLIVSS